MDTLKLIPQLFYDLIARVVPGSVAIIMVVVAVAADELGKLFKDFWDGNQTIQGSALFWGLGFLGAAYLTGHILPSISEWLEEKVTRRLFPNDYRVLQDAVSGSSHYPQSMRNFLIKELGLKEAMEGSEAPAGQYTRMLFVWNDWLQINQPDAGARVTKLRAEYRMHSGNVVAFFGALALHLIWTSVHQGYPNLGFTAMATLAGLASLRATAKMHRTFQRSVLQQFYIAKTSKVDAKPN